MNIDPNTKKTHEYL